MLMAAGLGTRLRPFTQLEPKPLLPLMGIPMAQFSVDALSQAGVRKIVANVHHQAERTRSGLNALDLGGARLEISDESQLLLGSAGGIRKALSQLGDGPFFLMNSDVLSNINLEALQAHHRIMREMWQVTVTLTVLRAGPASGNYTEILLDDERGLIRGLGAKARERPFFSGTAVVEPEALHGLAEGVPVDFVEAILKPAIERRQAGFHLASDIWHDVGSPQLWLDAHVAMIRGLETGLLPRAWRVRLEQVNRRLASETWISKRSERPAQTVEWSGPCYWDSEADPKTAAPGVLGPRAVIYGKVPEGGPFSDRISFRGVTP